jgi:hypothetical protein
MISFTDILSRANIETFWGILGAFSYYVDRILPLFDPPPPPAWTVFIPWAWTKTDIFLTPSPPHLVYVVIEWPLTLCQVGLNIKLEFLLPRQDGLEMIPWTTLQRMQLGQGRNRGIFYAATNIQRRRTR